MPTNILLRQGLTNPRNILLGDPTAIALTGIANMLIRSALLAGVGSETFSGNATLALPVAHLVAVGGGALAGDGGPLIRWEPLLKGYQLGRRLRR